MGDLASPKDELSPDEKLVLAMSSNNDNQEENQDDSGPLSLDQQITASLEKQKFQLLKHIALNNKTKAELEQKIKAAEAKALEKRQRLGEYNALFMSLENANDKAPRQKLGAREAVLGTKRIIDRELNKLSKEAAVTEMKWNKAKDKNIHMRAQVDGLRKEHLTFKKLFVAMTEELAVVKNRITRKYTIQFTYFFLTFTLVSGGLFLSSVVSTLDCTHQSCLGRYFYHYLSFVIHIRIMYIVSFIIQYLFC